MSHRHRSLTLEPDRAARVMRIGRGAGLLVGSALAIGTGTSAAYAADALRSARSASNTLTLQAQAGS